MPVIHSERNRYKPGHREIRESLKGRTAVRYPVLRCRAFPLFRASHISPCHHRAGKAQAITALLGPPKPPILLLWACSQGSAALLGGPIIREILLGGADMAGFSCYGPVLRHQRDRQPACSQVDYLLCICSQLPAGCLIPGHHTHRNTLAGELARELAGKSRLKRERSKGKSRYTDRKRIHF